MDTRTDKWDWRFMNIALEVASWSKDRSTRVGCVIVSPSGNILATGFNGFPRGCLDSKNDVLHPVDFPNNYAQLRIDVEARHERPAKYKWTVHAEVNAICNAACDGVSLKGATAYLPWFPCSGCMGALIQAGISCIVGERPDLNHSTFGEDFRIGLIMAKEAGVKLRYVESNVPLRSLVKGRA